MFVIEGTVYDPGVVTSRSRGADNIGGHSAPSVVHQGEFPRKVSIVDRSVCSGVPPAPERGGTKQRRRWRHRLWWGCYVPTTGRSPVEYDYQLGEDRAGDRESSLVEFVIYCYFILIIFPNILPPLHLSIYTLHPTILKLFLQLDIRFSLSFWRWQNSNVCKEKGSLNSAIKCQSIFRAMMNYDKQTHTNEILKESYIFYIFRIHAPAKDKFNLFSSCFEEEIFFSHLLLRLLLSWCEFSWIYENWKKRNSCPRRVIVISTIIFRSTQNVAITVRGSSRVNASKSDIFWDQEWCFDNNPG